jgi:hypothetical protein
VGIPESLATLPFDRSSAAWKYALILSTKYVPAADFPILIHTMPIWITSESTIRAYRVAAQIEMPCRSSSSGRVAYFGLSQCMKGVVLAGRTQRAGLICQAGR